MGLFILGVHYIGSLKSPLLNNSDSQDHKDPDRQSMELLGALSLSGYAVFAHVCFSALRWIVRR